MTATQTRAIEGQLAALCAASQMPKSESQCADCYEYTLSAEIDGAHYEMHVDDVTVGDAGLGELVASLSDLLQRALADELQ
jgi:hypothetical protein